MSQRSVQPEGNESAGSAAGWVIIGRISSQLFQLVLLLFATRYLAIAEFGLFALLQTIVLGGIRLASVGWRDFLIREDDMDLRRRAFALSALFGFALTGVWCLGALGAWQGGLLDAHAAALLAALSFTIGLNALNSAQAGDLIRRSRLIRLSQVQTISEFAGLAASAGFLMAGFGIWALLAGRLAAALVANVGYLVAGALIRPLRPNRAACAEVFPFIRVFFVSSVFDFFKQNGAILLIGLFLGLHEVGLFRAAARIVGALVEVGAESVRLISWRGLLEDLRGGRMQPAEIGVRIGERLGVTMLLAVPVFVGLALVAEPFVAVMLGKQWLAAAPVVAWLSIGAVFVLVASGTIPLLVALRKQEQVMSLSVWSLAVNLVTLFAGVQFGLIGAAIGQTAGWVLGAVLFLAAQNRVATISMGEWLRDSLVLTCGSVAMALATWGAAKLVLPQAHLILLALQVAAGALAYGLVIALGARRRLALIIGSFRRH
jgi:O-antigen/teichoic acid export membrane protein